MSKHRASYVGFLLVLAIFTFPSFHAVAQITASKKSSSEASQPSMADITDNTGIKSMQDMQNFLNALQTAIKNNDHQAASALVKYPLLVNGKTKSSYHTYKNAQELLANFDAAFDAHTKDAILHAGPAAKLFTNDEGVMIGNGEVWFTGWDSNMDPGGPIGIITINHM